jgi:arsenate reductase (thioredoxin)
MTKGTRENPYHVLFLCTGNSARSILAEAIVNRIGGGRFVGHSAGSHPKGKVNPHSLSLLMSLNHKVDDLRSKSWDEFAEGKGPPLDFVFTVCDDAAGEQCPYWPGQPMTAHWGQADPAAIDSSPAEIAAGFAEAYRMLNNRLTAFVNLPLAALDRLTLQQRLSDIGKAD